MHFLGERDFLGEISYVRKLQTKLSPVQSSFVNVNRSGFDSHSGGEKNSDPLLPSKSTTM